MMHAKEHGQPYNQQAYRERVCRAVADVVRRQVETGVDIVCDGEQGKPGFCAYVSERLSGFEPSEATSPTGP
jgi:5-methyltetrahydropteroyltriglutamate--homocysteine methyltransferase